MTKRSDVRPYWPHPRIAVGQLKYGKRGWFALAEKPAGVQMIAPMVAYGVLEGDVVRIDDGLLPPELHEVLERVAKERPHGW